MITAKQKKQQGKALSSAHTDFAEGLGKYAMYKTSNAEMSDELVQETFLKTWKYIVRGGKVDTMKAFLYHVLNHLIIDQYRKPKTKSLDAMIVKGFTPSVDTTENLLNYIDGKKAMMVIANLTISKIKNIQLMFVKEF